MTTKLIYIFFIFSMCFSQQDFIRLPKSNITFNILLIISYLKRERSIDLYNFEQTSMQGRSKRRRSVSQHAGRLDELELEKKYAGIALKFSSLVDEIRLTKRERGGLETKTGLTVLRKLYQQRPRDVDDLTSERVSLSLSLSFTFVFISLITS